MHQNNIAIAKKTLLILEKNKWQDISFSKIIPNQKNQSIKNKNDLLININKYFDYLLKENLVSIEKSSTKDMLFEVLMARLDILNEYRKSIKNLLNYFSSNPQNLVKLMSSFLESIILIATLSDIDVAGIKGATKIKGIFILYLLIIYTWSNDESESLEKTMTTLDKYLTNIEKLSKLIK